MPQDWHAMHPPLVPPTKACYCSTAFSSSPSSARATASSHTKPFFIGPYPAVPVLLCGGGCGRGTSPAFKQSVGCCGGGADPALGRTDGDSGRCAQAVAGGYVDVGKRKEDSVGHRGRPAAVRDAMRVWREKVPRGPPAPPGERLGGLCGQGCSCGTSHRGGGRPPPWRRTISPSARGCSVSRRHN